jgi:hypothetical protein
VHAVAKRGSRRVGRGKLQMVGMSLTDAAMWALAVSGVPFRQIEREDGTVDRWVQPRLEDWEVPRRDPAGGPSIRSSGRSGGVGGARALEAAATTERDDGAGA